LTVDAGVFIAGYTTADEGRICFEWNGKHAEEFVDRNMEFRAAIRDAVLADLSAAPLTLIRDLFRAETQFSREAWCIVDGIGALAETLLRRGGPANLDDYLEGKFQSFDASLGSAFAYDLPLAKAMLAEVRQRLSASPNSTKAGLWQAGEELFSQWVSDCERKHSEPGIAADRGNGNWFARAWHRLIGRGG
jgi:hypothetical protein